MLTVIKNNAKLFGGYEFHNHHFLSQPPVRTSTNLLQLHVTASSLSVCDYVKLYSDFDDYYIDYHTLGLQSSTLCCVRQNELDFQKFVLNQVIM